MGDYSYVDLSRLESIIEELKENEVEKVPMEYIISAFFPDAYDNIKQAVAQSYMEGFRAGKQYILEDDGK